MRGGRLNTRTGTHAIWRNPPAAPNAIRFLINDVSLSLTNGGRELVFAGARISCRARPSASCQHGRTQVLVLSPATSDGVLSSARILLGAH